MSQAASSLQVMVVLWRLHDQLIMSLCLTSATLLFLFWQRMHCSLCRHVPLAYTMWLGHYPMCNCHIIWPLTSDLSSLSFDLWPLITAIWPLTSGHCHISNCQFQQYHKLWHCANVFHSPPDVTSCTSWHILTERHDVVSSVWGMNVGVSQRS